MLYLVTFQMKQTKWTIYCHVHKATGRRYVGLTKMTWRKRWNRHVYNATRAEKNGRSHFWNAIRKYGKDAFDHEVLEVCDSLEDANEAEEKWIAHFDSTDPEKGFNIKRGGDHVPHSEKRNPWDQPEYRRRVTESMKERCRDPAWQAAQAARSKEINSRPEVRRKLSEATSRQFTSEEVRQKMSETVKALHQDPETAVKFRKGLDTANRNRASRTHCKNGHEFTEENTRVDDRGWRYCRRCAADRVKERDYEGRTHCVNGHELIEENVRFGKDGRRRTCLLCLPTRCKRGHEFTPENTRLNGRGSRVCVKCRRTRGRKDDARRRARKKRELRA